jgi:dienelactone hydrolase
MTRITAGKSVCPGAAPRPTLGRRSRLAALAAALATGACGQAAHGAADGGAGEPKRIFFGFCKSKDSDPAPMRQRGADAVGSVQARLVRFGFEGCVLQDLGAQALGPSNCASTAVSRASVMSALESCRLRLGTNDTVVIYSHSHGLMGRFGRQGGLALDGGGGEPRGRGPSLDWAEYAEQLLALPAKTVVVLTMACHSGGLVDYLNAEPKARSLWQKRREQGRDFLVLTSQNARSLSNPRQIDGEVVNPFTYAVLRAFDGAADGYRRGRAERQPDGAITLGELSDFIVDEARRHTRANDQANDPDPQAAGSFDPDTIVASGAAAAPVKPAAAAAAPAIQDVKLEGERWTCAADGKTLAGLLLKPAGEGPFPAIVLSHGLGGSAQTMMRTRGAELVKWGFVCIATDYTHAGAGGGGRGSREGVDFSQAGARPENIRRGLACIEILRSRKDVDPTRIALYGHSMGAFLTIALAAAAPDKVAAAAITAGGVVADSRQVAAAPTAEVANRVRAPFLILHGTVDTTVAPQSSERLKQSLDRHGVPNARHLFEGVGHGLPNEKSDDVNRLLREWFIGCDVLAKEGRE